MIRRQQQFGGITERLVARKPLRIGMAVRADDGQIANFRVQTARNLTDGRIGRKQTVFVQV
jgi:uncharacterized protein YwbE